MDDGESHWDDRKAVSNFAAHGVTFEVARDVFRDPFALDWRDVRMDYGEDRFITLGVAKGRLLFVAYTERGWAIRIISARGAGPHERRRYEAVRF